MKRGRGRFRVNVEVTFSKIINIMLQFYCTFSVNVAKVTDIFLSLLLADYCFYFHLNFEIDLPVASLQIFSRELPGMSANHKVYFFPSYKSVLEFSHLFFRSFLW